MTPQEKAIELVLIYSKIKTRYKDSIKCALIAVDEILNQFTWKPLKGYAFWDEVKKEIEKL